MEGLPEAEQYIVADKAFLTFYTADELRIWFAKYKKERDGKKVAKGMRAGAKKVSALSKARDVQNAIKPDNQKKKE